MNLGKEKGVIQMIKFPIIMIKGQEFILDVRLKEIRHLEEPHYSYPLSDFILGLKDEITGEDLIDIYLDEILKPQPI